MAKKKSESSAPVERKSRGPALPTRDQVLALPFWPRIAFCARVARRLVPLVAHCWETEVEIKYLRKAGHLRGTRSCVRQAELAAAKAGIVSEQALYDARGVAGTAASQAEYAAELVKRKKGSPQYAASYAASAAELAATGAFTRTRPDWNCEFGQIIWNADEAGKAFGASAAVNAAVRADYETLSRLVAEKQWADETPVSPRTFGPLWPDGPPEGWPTRP